jgi:hypothetical protein
LSLDRQSEIANAETVIVESLQSAFRNPHSAFRRSSIYCLGDWSVARFSLMCGMARRGGSPTVRGGVDLRHPSWSGYRRVPLAEDLAWLPPCSVG